jgi:hypothetical protein
MNDSDNKTPRNEGTLAALLREKPKRGRPRSVVSRQSVYVALSPAQKATISTLAEQLPEAFVRADVPDLAIALLSARFEQVRSAMADRDRELPEGVTDLQALYYLWDVPLTPPPTKVKWTSVRLSPQQVVQFGRLQGTLNALFGTNRSQVFTLALSLLSSFLEKEETLDSSLATIVDFEAYAIAHPHRNSSE